MTEDEAILAAVSHGADEAALRQEMQNPDIIAAFQATYALAEQLSITGTPSYVVGDEVVFGAMGQEVLAEKIEQVRAENPVLIKFSTCLSPVEGVHCTRSLCVAEQADYRGCVAHQARRVETSECPKTS